MYQLDLDNGKIQRIIEQHVDQSALVIRLIGQEGLIWCLSEDRINRYVIQSTDPESPLEELERARVVKTHVYDLPSIKAELTSEWTIEPLQKYETLQLAETAMRQTAFLRNSATESTMRFKLYNADKTLRQEGVVDWEQPKTSAGAMNTIVAAAPPVLIAGAAVNLAINSPIPNRSVATMFPIAAVAATVLHCVIAAALAFWLSGLRSVGFQMRVLWTALAALLGMSMLLAIVAIYPSIVRELCPRCDMARRVDQEHCDKCGSEWDRPVAEGIEIIGKRMLADELVSGGSVG